jgi:hypothetical protein
MGGYLGLFSSNVLNRARSNFTYTRRPQLYRFLVIVVYDRNLARDGAPLEAAVACFTGSP